MKSFKSVLDYPILGTHEYSQPMIFNSNESKRAFFKALKKVLKQIEFDESNGFVSIKTPVMVWGEAGRNSVKTITAVLRFELGSMDIDGKGSTHDLLCKDDTVETKPRRRE